MSQRRPKKKLRECENPDHVNCNDKINECGFCGSLNITENTGIENWI